MKTVDILSQKEIYLKKDIDENDLEGLESFYILSFNQDGIVLEQQDDYINNEKFSVTLEELKEKYISLKEFLINSEYIGREGYRTSPTVDGDTRFMPDNLNPHTARIIEEEKKNMSDSGLVDEEIINKTEILYKGDTHYLLLCTNTLLYPEPELQLISSKYIDNNWSFVGKTNKSYKSKNLVYGKIRKQIKENKISIF